MAADGSITGTVVGPSGKPLSGVLVRATGFFNPGAPYDATTGADGRFSLVDLPDDFYRLAFLPTSMGYAPEWWQDAATQDTASFVSVTAGSAFDLPVALQMTAGFLGRVTDSAGNPIAGVSVSTDLGGAAATASDGTYEFPGPPGTYRLQFEDPAGRYVTEWWDDAPTLDQASPITLNEGETLTFDAVLAEVAVGASVSGTVRSDTTGAPLSGIMVFAVGPDSKSVVTDQFGNYAIAELPAGTYTLRFEDPSGRYFTEWWDNVRFANMARPITVANGDALTFDASLAQKVGTGSIRGTVQNTNGVPLPNIMVTIMGGQIFTNAITNSFGQYAVGALPPGEYKVLFSDFDHVYQSEWWDNAPDSTTAQPIVLADGGIVTNINASLERVDAATISGRVTDGGGNPVAGTTVTAIPVSGVASLVRTDAEGNYSVEVSPGEHRIRFQPPPGTSLFEEFYDNARSFADADLVVATANSETPGIDAQLDRPGVITGRVTANGEPVSGVRVTVRGAAFAEAYTIADGTYTFRLPTAGSYMVHFDPTGSELRSEWYDDAEQLGDATAITVQLNETVTANADLSSGGSLSGVITDTSGTPIPGTRVEANNDGRWFTTVTDEDGRYTFIGLAGATIVRAAPSTGWNYEPRYWPDTTSIADAGRIYIESGATLTGYDIAVRKFGAMSGMVSSDAGAVAASVDVTIYPVGEDGFVRQAVTGADGAWSVPDLAPGTYRVQFANTPSLALVGEFWDDAADESDATLMTITDGDQVTGIDATLQEAAMLRGRVLNAAGEPIRFATMSYSDSVDQPGQQTGPDGEFGMLVRPGSGTATVFPGAPYLPATVEYTAVSGETTEFDIVVEVGPASLSGAFVPPSGVTFGTVSAHTTEGEFLASSFVFGDTYLLPNLPVGPIVVTGQVIMCPSPTCVNRTHQIEVTLVAGENHADILFPVPGSITGRVSDDLGNPVAGESLGACDADPCTEGLGFAVTDADGRYRFDNIRPGDVAINIRREVHLAVVESGATTTVDLVLTRGMTITGTVTTSSGSAEVDGSLGVFATGSDGMWLGSAQIEQDGNYTIPNVPAEPVSVCIEREDPFGGRSYLVVECWENAGSRSGATILIGAPGDTISGIDFVLGGPGIVTDLVATPGAGEVALAWDVPYSGGRPITDYVVQVSLVGEPWAAFDDGVSATTGATVTGLAPGSEYRFRVAAVNSYGTGVASDPATATVPATVPSAPQDLTATVQRGGGPPRVRLTWSPPAVDGGSPVVDYVIQRSRTGRNSWVTIDDGVGTATTYTVTGLSSIGSYFRIIARNSVGDGPPCAPVRATR